MTVQPPARPTPDRDYGPGCERHKGDPHNLCPKCWELEPDPKPLLVGKHPKPIDGNVAALHD